ncbi:hypothetical protein LshimejAT787_1601400 [Lyophyllum shimeji]|uniref:Uncharacterized protein n=1 Tax=Lyophyllum shimeji TaxID=47721 RepID=A0A9P3PY79_LYOSH|nr:hypothetical protein LshimejAT787_1601400 [Lyophyllum shimeji]
MSLGEADGKFPTANQYTGLPPSPTRENPGQVFPKSDPQPAPISPPPTGPEQYIGNPFLMNGALRKVDHAFGEVIAILESEENSHSGAHEESPLLQRFRRWREELDILRGEFRTPSIRTPSVQTAAFQTPTLLTPAMTPAIPTPSVESRAPSRMISHSPEEGGMFAD